MVSGLTTAEIERRVRALMPGVVEDIRDLIRYPSVSFPGYPAEPVHAMACATADVLKRSGLPDAHLMEIPRGYPSVYGEIPAPPGAPTILLYAHYDVQPAKIEDGWDSDPWTPVEKDGRLYGRGAADNKSGIVIIAAALRVFDGKPPVGVKVIIEGEEETAGHLEEFAGAHPDLFRCDLFVVADTGNITAGDPVLTTTLRGVVSCIIKVRTLDHAVHSGSFGGPAPDALVALIRILSTLHDPQGNVAVKGLRESPAGTAEYPEELFRQNAGVLPGVDLAGTGPIGSRLWAKPSVTVIGIDAPSVTGAANILIPHASAKVSMRIAPDADPRRELQILADHLRAAAPWNARVTIQETGNDPGFVCPAGGPGFAAAKRAMEAAFRKPVQEKGTGGSIPLMRALRDAVPGAEFVLWGASDDAGSFIHGPNESVDIRELERFIVAQALLMQEMGEGW
ncbi:MULTISPECIES: M20/M25/M40 family metallo-hydrolase [unclassified Methanoregula]|uniref:M20/M25/M40 family metallo-hydrolase n=1 Tax=unclassified Methanoregula TaxID=2649730 RepID=UPI0009CBCE6D|nr:MULTISPECIES: M20/M25/M40 family metallo-hydrolase [unclassified Methanoregula]OPX65338.1 MAG: putative metallohydrolase [Methanoregula sp. PtaB.Bin085]OPY32247.1 MAG: putative metallohydrolase [Methanoregula sp. PtaU1.Bin006]